MTQEILFTSAPRGLKPGSRGFCTVKSSAGMASTLATKLESLSGYAHAHLSQAIESSQNPVNYSHLIIRVGGQVFHVLSRICDAGADYTKRTNKLAHHVALMPKEIGPADPAWTLRGRGFCEHEWDGEVGILRKERLPRQDPCRGGVCNAWKKITGDAGWAGVLAASARTPQQPMSVIFEPGTDTLPLVVEAMSLLPPSQQWKVTFSTYYTKLPAGVDCQWRFVLDGSQEARMLRRNPHANVIDLQSPGELSESNEYIEMARSGERRSTKTKQPQQKKAVRVTNQPVDKTDPMAPIHDGSIVRQEYDLQQAPTPSQRITESGFDSSPPLVHDRGGSSRRTSRSRRSEYLMYAVFGVSAIMFLGSLVLLAVVLLSPGDNQLALNDTSAAATPAPKDVSLTPQPKAANNNDLDEPVPDPDFQESPTEPDNDSSMQGMEEEPASPGPEEPAPSTDETELATRNSPEDLPLDEPAEDIDPSVPLLRDVLKGNSPVLALPPVELNKRHHLARVDGIDLEAFNLELVGMDLVFDPLPTIDDQIDASGKQWLISTSSRGPVGVGKTVETIGTFYLNQHTLSFEWHTQDFPELRYCTLNITNGRSTILFALNASESGESPILDLSTNAKGSINLALGSSSLARGILELLAADITMTPVTARDGIVFASNTPAAGSPTRKFLTIKDSDGNGTDTARLSINLITGKPSKLEYAFEYWLPSLNAPKKPSSNQIRWQSATHRDITASLLEYREHAKRRMEQFRRESRSFDSTLEELNDETVVPEELLRLATSHAKQCDDAHNKAINDVAAIKATLQEKLDSLVELGEISKDEAENPKTVRIPEVVALYDEFVLAKRQETVCGKKLKPAKAVLDRVKPVVEAATADLAILSESIAACERVISFMESGGNFLEVDLFYQFPNPNTGRPFAVNLLQLRVPPNDVPTDEGS